MPLLVLLVPITLFAGPAGGRMESDLPGPIADFLNQIKEEFEHAKYQYITNLSISKRGRPLGYEIPIYSNVQGPVGEYVMDWAMRRGLSSPWWDIKRRSLENIDTIPAKGFRSVGFHQRQILKKDLYAIGTSDNFLIHYILRESLGKQIRLESQSIIIGDEIFTGKNLVMKVIVPNPFEPKHYALLIAATSEAALMNLEDLNEDQYDLALYRGKRLLATGYFDRTEKEWILKPLGIRRQNWSIEQYGPLTQYSRTGQFLNPEWILERMRAVTAFLRLPDEEEIRLFVYPTLKEKAGESGDRNYTHLDLAGGAIHTAATRGDALGPFITEILVYRKFGMTGGPVLRRGFAAGIDQQLSGSRSCEEHERHRLGALISIKTSLENGRSLNVEKLGILIRFLINRNGFVRFEQFFSGVDGAFARRFKNFYGSRPVEFEEEIDAYLETECRKITLARMAATIPKTEEKNPDDLLQAGISSFLAENYLRAEEQTRLALTGAGWEDHELRSWAYFNLGRSLAMTGNIPEAGKYLDLSVHLEGKQIGVNGERATVASRHWLGNLGKSQNFNERVRQALVDSKNSLADFEWEKAVHQLDEALSVDSGNTDVLLLRGRINRERHAYLQQKIDYLNQSNPVGPLIDLTFFDRFQEEAIHDQNRAGTLLLEDAVQSKTEGYLNLQRFLEEFKEQNRSGEWEIDSLGIWLEKAEASFSKHLTIKIDGVRFGNPQARTGIGITRIYRSKIARLEGRMKSSREHLQMAGIMLAVIIPDRTAEPAIRDQARTYLAYSGYLLGRFHTEDAGEKILLYREAVKQFDKSLRSAQIGPQFRQYTRKGLMKTLTYLGFEEFELDRFKQSKKHFHQALEIIEENFPEMEFWERLVHSNLVEVDERLGNPN